LPFIRLNEIKEMDSNEREVRLRELQIELSKLRAMIHAGGALEKPSRVREIRKAIARILTIQNLEKLKMGKKNRLGASD
jgi:large subunit ribosomal protein L29